MKEGWGREVWFGSLVRVEVYGSEEGWRLMAVKVGMDGWMGGWVDVALDSFTFQWMAWRSVLIERTSG